MSIRPAFLSPRPWFSARTSRTGAAGVGVRVRNLGLRERAGHTTKDRHERLPLSSFPRVVLLSCPSISFSFPLTLILNLASIGFVFSLILILNLEFMNT